jgi:hypothetical protein
MELVAYLRHSLSVHDQECGSQITSRPSERASRSSSLTSVEVSCDTVSGVFFWMSLMPFCFWLDEQV